MNIPDKAEVIVVGGGGAGLCAAAAASQSDASVVLVSKTPVGLASCTTYAGGGFTLAVGGMTPEEHRARTLGTGWGLNDNELVHIFSEEAPRALSRLADLGIPLKRSKGRATILNAKNPMIRGEVMTRHLRTYALQRGVEMVSPAAVTKILSDDAGCTGVEVVDLRTGRVSTIAAKAVILATGGGGRIYERTDNPARTTGDGYRLGFEVGLSLKDMEFVQFYPLGFQEPGFPIWYVDLALVDAARLTDSQGREFLREKFGEWGIRSGKEANLYFRDQATGVVAGEWQRGGAVYMHFEDVPAQEWDNSELTLVNRIFSKASLKPVRVAPLEHYFSGGLVIDSFGRTELAGLYACGEVTGGVDGANRVGGNALANIAVFGFRAGEAAARYVESAEFRTSAKELKTPKKVARWNDSEGGEDPAALRREIQQLAERHLGPVRDESGLKQAEQHLDKIKDKLACQLVKGSRDLLLALENESLLLTASLVCKSALLRTESRGVHLRSDCPNQGSDRYNIVIRAGTNGNPEAFRQATNS